MSENRYELNKELAQMLKGGVIMDVTTPEQAKIAEEAGACAVMALERIPADIRAAGGVARMSDPKMIKGIQDAVSIPVMAKCRIGHFAEAQILEAIEIDYIDESEVLSPADDVYHINKKNFGVPFVCGAKNLGEALRRISEGASMIRTKGEPGTGDVVQAGFVISNSEVGLGSVKVEPLIYRLVCKNGMISKDFSQRKYHVGRQVDGDAAYELYSDETLQADDKAFFMKVQDTVKVAADKSKFMLTVGKMRESLGIRLEGNPVEEVELLADRFQLTQNERGDILRQLFMGGDNSRYGLLNAVTAASQLSASYERATELERIGGEILSLPVGSKALKMRRSDDVAEGIVEELPVIRPVRAITA